MLTLGHIHYSNCFPVHAAILQGKLPFPFTVREGIPTELNKYLAEGEVDVSPSSSIEYALNADKYLIMPGLSITSRVKALSIILESSVPIAELDGRNVALTTASATSVILLRIILELFEDVSPRFTHYEQGRDDPYARADAVLTIGDLALKRAARPSLPHVLDLGEIWHVRTGLPFVFALWQINWQKSLERELGRLYDVLQESKAYGLSRLPLLANENAGRFGLAPEDLLRYWRTFSYDFGADEQKGLLAYYGYAAEIGVIDRVPELRFWQKGS
jgi:chorismate dehydratase